MRDGDHPETLGDGAEVQLQRAELVGEWRVVGQQGASAAPPRRLEHGGRRQRLAARELDEGVRASVMKDRDHPEPLGDGADVRLQRAELVGDWVDVGAAG
jgi:hypothetical protein